MPRRRAGAFARWAERWVHRRGQVTKVEVRQSLGLGLDEKAVEAIRKWRFRPARKDGRPVPSVALVDVGFRLL